MSKYLNVTFTLLLLSTYSLSAIASGDSCPQYDLSKEEFLTSDFDQGESDWCFAFAASASVSSLLKQPISATDLALHHNIREAQASLTITEDPSDILKVSLTKILGTTVFEFGGSVTEASNLLLKKGYCLESNLSSNTTDYKILLDQYGSKTALEIMKMMESKCSTRIKANGYLEVMATVDEIAKQKASQIIEKNLANSLISAISIDGNIVRVANGKEPKTSRMTHAVAIVGQRIGNNNECELIIRDSGFGKNLFLNRKIILDSMDELYYPVRSTSARYTGQSHLELPSY